MRSRFRWVFWTRWSCWICQVGVRKNHDAENNIGAKGMNRLAESVLRGHHLPHLRVLIVHCVDTWYSVT